MPTPLSNKGTRVPVLLSDRALSNFEKMAEANGFSYVPQMLKHLLENLSLIDPARFHATIVAMQEAGKAVESKPKKTA